ncbi:MAG TPA: serine/threonine-protein kinase [Thermoanaerobaculia bacterium]|nr:serine/threonine-protein kinase [Thermoanaerobaculia bacterium]
MPFFCIHCKSEIDSKYKACPFCGEPITDFLRRYLETPLDGKYQILARLGVGGMGEVYKVLHIHLNAIRVVKLMRANIAGEEGAHDRFLREARLATKIQHPNVAALYDFSTLDETSRYMVWEYIEGINLHELVTQRGPLAPRYAAKLAVQALMGLEAIHRAGIVHRDVSPENLMLTRDDEGQERVKIIDLGIAKSSAAEDNKTKTGIFVGKWKYCSPEHLGMLPAGERIDGRADLYSFGIVLYEMLTGVPPFVADTPHAYLMKHASERPKSIVETNPSVLAAPELEALIFRALEKDRNKRYASAREFAQAIERIAAGLPDTPGAPPPVPAAAELTNQEPPTVVSVQQATPTVASGRTPALRTLDRVEVEDDAERRAGFSPPGRAEARPTWPLYAGAIVFAVLLAGAWMFLRPRPEPPAPSPQAPRSIEASTMTATTTVAPAAPIPVAQGHLGINAFPWANVTSVRNLDNGQSVDIGSDLVTPAALDLAPGRYEVTLSNGGKPVTRTVSLGAGANETVWVSFGDAASAKVPDFGGNQ